MKRPLQIVTETLNLGSLMERVCRLHRVGATALLSLLAIVLVSCGPKPAAPPSPAIYKPARIYDAPTELTARPSHKRIDLTWKTNRTENTLISGYNVYLWSEENASDTSNGGFRRINQEPYPGDTVADIERESYPLEGVDDGVIYRVYITTVYADGMESAKSNVAEVIPRPEGGFKLRESFKGNESGFSFRKIKSVPTDDLDNDIYLASISGALWIASPQRINVVLRQTEFYRISDHTSFEVAGPITLSGKPDNTLRISEGLILILHDHDKRYALLRIDSVDYREKSANIFFIYQPRPETLIFH